MTSSQEEINNSFKKKPQQAKHRASAQTDHNLLNLYYTNADSVFNKMEELIEAVEENSIDIIVITEAMPKNAKSRPSLAEITVPGYDVFTSKTFDSEGRGVYIMVKSCLKASPVTELTNHKFKESVWCIIKNREGRQVLIG